MSTEQKSDSKIYHFNSAPPETELIRFLTPALFTPVELSILRKAVRDADSDLARKYFQAGIDRAAEHLRAKKGTPK
jgi:hypothetical protein